ncbi:MAG: PilT/PilU family type 4a pilus ATPase [Planctomycetota bacterium]
MDYAIQRLIGAMRELDASDLHIKVGLPPVYRVGGTLKPVRDHPMSENEADHLLDPIIPEGTEEKWKRTGALDFATHLPDGDRFRVNMFRAGGHTHAAIRRVKGEIPTYESLSLPAVYGKIVETYHEGLVIVCGVTGSGKSTTLAAMIDHVNTVRSVNIITIEDPVEFRFRAKKSVVSQREIGIDVPDFPTAMRSVVRQDPDVIFVGEMRDRETLLAAIQAAETGHLVFATLHTADTMQAMGRILEFFPQEERAFVRTSLSNSLKAICAQRLLPSVKGYRAPVVPATEVLLINAAAREYIRESRDKDLPTVVASGASEGMRSFNDSLVELVEAESVDLHTALEYSPNPDKLSSQLKGLSVKTSQLTG